MSSISLYFTEGCSDKEYHAMIVPSALDGAFDVTFRYGRRGTALTCGTKATALVRDKAEKVFSALVKSKTAKGYVEAESGAPYVARSDAAPVRGLVPMLLNPINDEDLNRYFQQCDYWILQEKMDGKRVMIQVDKHGDVSASNRRGLPCAIPLATAQELALFQLADSVLDGELIGSAYHVFDVLKLRGRDMTAEPYSDRLQAYVGIAGRWVRPVPAIPQRDASSVRATIALLKKRGAEGIVLKDPFAPYTTGRPNSGGAALKYKFVESSTCLVSSVSATKRSIGLSLMDESLGTFVEVGNVTVPPNQPIPEVGNCVEVRYLYRFEQGALFQPVLLGSRDDVLAQACTTSQVTRIKSPALETDDE